MTTLLIEVTALLEYLDIQTEGCDCVVYIIIILIVVQFPDFAA